MVLSSGPSSVALPHLRPGFKLRALGFFFWVWVLDFGDEINEEEGEIGVGIVSHHTVAYDPFLKSQLASTQLTSGPYAVQIWSRIPHNSGGTTPS